jgi:hypothetical protein
VVGELVERTLSIATWRIWRTRACESVPAGIAVMTSTERPGTLWQVAKWQAKSATSRHASIVRQSLPKGQLSPHVRPEVVDGTVKGGLSIARHRVRGRR